VPTLKIAFSCIKSSIQCCNQNEDCWAATVEQIVTRLQNTSSDQETVDDTN
jgi:hypothetical protein